MKCANPQCGEEFFPSVARQKYCSKACWTSDYYHRPLHKVTSATCVICGKEFKPCNYLQKYCSPECYMVSEKKRNRRKAIERVKPKPKPKTKPKPAKTLEQWAREAAECNLDYGTYRGLIQLGKTYEELKATADTRHLQAHSSIKRKRSD